MAQLVAIFNLSFLIFNFPHQRGAGRQEKPGRGKGAGFDEVAAAGGKKWA